MKNIASVAEALVVSIPKPVMHGHTVVIRKKKILCVEGRLTEPGDKVIHFLTTQQINTGLASYEWIRFIKTLRKHEKEIDS